jgi:hypothetical protein
MQLPLKQHQVHASVSMTRNLSISTVLTLILLSSGAAAAVTITAPCGSFKKLSNGNWAVVKPIKIENGNNSAFLNPGTIVGPGSRVAGFDIYAALQSGCP